ncbi:MAG TPA: MOSC N-terminal beta barrel domain-containing protein [Pseudolabrys sp.]|nr:MOSC N-terminal beta barrel domain-containing protein [Pseudolabrys sp.]
MFVKEIWRYPVKSMAGERVREADVGKLGIAGDRTVLVHAGG